jgi:hypothetical protein
VIQPPQPDEVALPLLELPTTPEPSGEVIRSVPSVADETGEINPVNEQHKTDRMGDSSLVW